MEIEYHIKTQWNQSDGFWTVFTGPAIVSVCSYAGRVKIFIKIYSGKYYLGQSFSSLLD